MANPFAVAARTIDHTPAQRRGFSGASSSRLYSDWAVGGFSPDFEGRGVRQLLRWRARQLVNDNAYAHGFIDELANNVVGPRGIVLQAEITTVVDELHSGTNDKIEAAWEDWGLPENASADGHDSWIDLQKLAIATIAVDGECFLRKRRYYDNNHAYALQFIDADQVDDGYTVLPSIGQNEIRSGVEIDANGRPVAYHIWTRHLSDSGQRIRQRVSADEIIHLFVRYRGAQTRGITWFAPVLTSVKMYDGLTEAELVASRASAAKMGFIVTKDPMHAASSINPDDDPEQDRLMEAAAGTLEELPPGQEIQTFDPQHPNAVFKDFTQVILRGVARGLGISYTALTGDLTGVNYSSIRAGMLAERDNWRSIQIWLYTQLHRRVYKEWVKMALLTGALSVDTRLASDYSKVSWKPRGWAWVDPLKDVQATILAIHNGLDSRTDALDEEGKNIEDVFENLAEEIKLAKKFGIEVDPAGSVTAPTKVEGDGEPQDGNQDGNQNQDGAPKGRARLNNPTLRLLQGEIAE
jgi:lambda family phage portal protein